MSLLSRLLHSRHTDGAPDARRVDEAVERIVKLSPHLHLARHYRSRLEPAVATSLKYVGDIVASASAAREASAAAWSADPYIHAFFVAPTDIAPALSRSTDLREFFEQNTDSPEAYAVLGMAMSERRALGVALEGDAIRRDVVQTTVSFSDHQVRICGRTESDLRQEIVLRLVDQLGLEGLARIEADKSRRDLLERERALLKTRLQLLERQGIGIRSLFGDDATAESGESGRLKAQIEENERSLNSLGIRSEALDRALNCVCDVLANPSQHIYVESKRFRLDKMNVARPEDSTEPSDDITIQIARIPTTPPRMRAFTLVRFARSELSPATSMFAGLL
ncbi:MAG TPA: hypothetical protein VM532_15730 [Burkholderiales bacterium]|nr:hypothetical protein [Burkholderiales bacterium]